MRIARDLNLSLETQAREITWANASRGETLDYNWAARMLGASRAEAAKLHTKLTRQCATDGAS